MSKASPQRLKLDPELQLLFEKRGPPRPFLPDPGNIEPFRARWRVGTERFARSSTVQKALNNVEASHISTRDISIRVRDGATIAARVYSPKGSTSGAEHPLIVFFHGGGLCLGGIDTDEVLCKLFCASQKAVVLNVDYRLAPEHPFPVGVQDSFDAVLWAANHSSELGVDLSKGFIVGGVSGGGNFAAVIAHLWRDAVFTSQLTGIFMSIPILENGLKHGGSEVQLFEPDFRSFEENANAPVLDKALSERFRSILQPDEQSSLWNVFVLESFSALPRTYLQTCELDPYRDGCLIYQKLLRRASIETRLNLYPGLPHSFWSVYPELQATERWITDSINGMSWLLGRSLSEQSRL